MNEVASENAVSWIFPGAVPLQQLQVFREKLVESFIIADEDYLEF